ncbi:MAG TPA: sensor histidine kinase [Bacteroidales bacterium]|nr:sensor histidine kinase [Bacteroidales bacterium]
MMLLFRKGFGSGGIKENHSTFGKLPKKCYFRASETWTFFIMPPLFKQKHLAFLLLLLYFCLSSTAFGSSVNQWPENKKSVDSINHLIRDAKDSASVYSLFALATSIADKINYEAGLASAYDRLGCFLRNTSKYRQALEYHTKALTIANKINDISLQENILNNIGVVYRRINNTKLALEYHMKALMLAEKYNHFRTISISTNCIGNIYLSLNQYEEALKCFRKVYPLEQKEDNRLGMAINMQNIGSVFRQMGQTDSALHYYRLSLKMNAEIWDKNGIAICNSSIGSVLLMQNEVDEAMKCFNKALEIDKELKDKIYLAMCYNNLGNAWLMKGNPTKAKDYFNNALETASAIGSKSECLKAYSGLSECLKKMKRFEQALKYAEIAKQYSDSLQNEENVKNITQIRSQYDFEKKEQQITLLNKEKEASYLYNLLLATALVIFLTIAFFAILNIRQKRKITRQELSLKEQKIHDLEREKQLIATQMVLQGEETERARLARDLHDGLGGLLSGVKLSMAGIKNNPDGTENSQVDKALQLLDISIAELRRMAHNLMPESLVKYGLHEALSDFCNSMDNTSCKVIFNFYGQSSRLDKKFENNLYRIAQELINNALKHAQATEIIVQLVQEHNRINLTVQDNGKGFDTRILEKSKSSGIANIRSRVESLNGWLEITSNINQGTEITIEYLYH